MTAQDRTAATRSRTCCVYCGERIGVEHWKVARWRYPTRTRRLACILHAHLVARDPEYTS